jgi:PleD family two-component response regulator
MSAPMAARYGLRSRRRWCQTPTVVSHRAIVHIEDINDRRAAREDLAHRAGHDDLTGLPNRHTFRDRLADALGSVNRGDPLGALLFCDIRPVQVRQRKSRSRR